MHFPLTLSYLTLMLLLRAGRPIYAKGNHFPPPRLSISSSHIFIATADRTTSNRSDGAAAHHHRQAALWSLSCQGSGSGWANLTENRGPNRKKWEPKPKAEEFGYMFGSYFYGTEISRFFRFNSRVNRRTEPINK